MAILIAASIAAIPLGASAVAGGFQTERPDRAAMGLSISTPIFAYYAIDHTPQAWSRSRGDLPLLGRYASDEESVIRRRIMSAKAAGITGFFVRWKAKATLDARLAQLIALAEEEDFKLGIAYDASKVDGSRLHPRRVRRDLDRFLERFASSAAFDSLARPLVIWSGTENCPRRQVARTTRERRDSLLIVASESSVAGVTRLGGTVDGNAYEWASLDPERRRGFAVKLDAIGDAVRASGGIWIPGVSPGLEAARTDGGSDVVRRRAGQTLTASSVGSGGTIATSSGARLNGAVVLGAVVFVGVLVLLAVARRSWRDHSGEADYAPIVRSL